MSDVTEIYREASRQALAKVPHFLAGGNFEPDELEHIIDIGSSVMMTRDEVLPGGSFVQAIVEDKLYESFSRADTICVRAIRFFAYCNRHIFPTK